MQQVPSIFIRFPVVASFTTVILTITSIMLTAAVVSMFMAKAVAGDVSRILITTLLVYGTVKLKITPKEFVFLPSSSNYLLASLPMLGVATLNWFFIEWDLIQFGFGAAGEWLLAAAASGLFEEGMMRAVVFLMLWKAWQSKKHGLFFAALTQACVFGVLHLLNFGSLPHGALLAQIAYAIFLGFGFAGLVAYTRSIWPAVVVHATINLFGLMNSAFVPGYIEQVEPTLVYVALCVVIFFLAALPGWKCLRTANADINNHRL